MTSAPWPIGKLGGRLQEQQKDLKHQIVELQSSAQLSERVTWKEVNYFPELHPRLSTSFFCYKGQFLKAKI